MLAVDLLSRAFHMIGYPPLATSYATFEVKK